MTFPTRTPAEQERLDVYNALRAGNPHLPPPSRVAARGFVVDYGSDVKLPTITLTVFLDPPKA